MIKRLPIKKRYNKLLYSISTLNGEIINNVL